MRAILPHVRAVLVVVAIVVALAVPSASWGAAAAVAAPPPVCPTDAPVAVCDPGAGPSATPSPAPGGSGFPDGCLPGSVDPACPQEGGGTPSASPAPGNAGPGCTGLGCLPQVPTTSTPAGPAPTAPGAGATGFSSGLNSVIDGFFRWLVSSALNPLLDLVSQTLLTTPTVESLPRVAQLWDTSWQILVAVYALLVLAAGAVLMAYETLQTRYTVREILPRLVVGFLAGALSLWVSARGIDLANGLSAAVAGDDVDAASAGSTLRAIAVNASGGAIAYVLLGLFLAAMLVVLLLTYIVRVALTVLLVVGAPLALMFHALPHTEGIARWWWKAFTATLAIQVGQSLALITAIKIFLAPGGVSLFGTMTDSGLVNILVAVALVYVLIKIPFWMLSAIRGGGGRSFAGSLVRGFIAYKTFGLLGRGGRRGGGGRASRPSPSGVAANPATDDPYARVRATAEGQYMLPLGELRRRRPGTPPPMPPTPRPKPQGRGRQLTLPLGDDWPENKPVLGRDGQYELPLGLTRTPRVAPPPSDPAAPGRAPRRPRSRQLELPFDPYAGIKPDRSGQYRLPLDGVRRVPRPPAPPPPVPSAPRGRGRQLRLPLEARTPDPYAGIRPNRAGQYPLPLDVRRVPKPAPPPSPPPPVPPRAARPGRQLRLPLDIPAPPGPSPTPPKPAPVPRDARTRRRNP